MRFYSTEGKNKDVSFKEAVLQGFAPDGGLYLPHNLPQFTAEQLKKLRGLSFLELSIELGKELLKEELRPAELITICEEAFNFPLPFISFHEGLYLLELFHGPTLSFKDFGARFLAALLKNWEKELIVLVATSGDTGSAVGQAFCGILGMKVFILYPKGKVTLLQEQQLTTIGHNVHALEIEGSFEDCQEMLKKAVMDSELNKKIKITTANSINIGRLLPQALYYFYAYCELEEQCPPIFSIPCGNFGHLVSGMLAKRMGLPVQRFLGATNINDEVPLYLRSGVFRPHPAYPTVAVSMDVGNPSNFPRLIELYEHSIEKLRKDLLGISFTDEQIIEAIQEMLATHGYLLDPHSATAYLALREYLILEKRESPGIFFATAHPAKFQEKLKPYISAEIPLPSTLQTSFPKKTTLLPNTYDALVSHLKK